MSTRAATVLWTDLGTDTFAGQPDSHTRKRARLASEVDCDGGEVAASEALPDHVRGTGLGDGGTPRTYLDTAGAPGSSFGLKQMVPMLVRELQGIEAQLMSFSADTAEQPKALGHSRGVGYSGCRACRRCQSQDDSEVSKPQWQSAAIYQTKDR